MCIFLISELYHLIYPFPRINGKGQGKNPGSQHYLPISVAIVKSPISPSLSTFVLSTPVSTFQVMQT